MTEPLSENWILRFLNKENRYKDIEKIKSVIEEKYSDIPYVKELVSKYEKNFSEFQEKYDELIKKYFSEKLKKQ